MTFAAHLSKSNENSLEARVKNFRVAYAAYRDIQTSQSVHKHSDMQNTLGTSDELTQANTIIKNSLDIAVKNFSKSDLQKAQQQGLLSDFEAKNIDAISIGKDLTSSNEKGIQENKDRIAQARAEMSDKNKDKSKDKSRDI
ncbi:hypothetical protein [Colwellia sp. BRX10-4]|jgi:hypothetical protein|uniref:hypothetical protein n=1 Tax=Colwellia sp. BRX10-4 TaxID=2759843 RepID=UPI0015F60BD4|nr:hypothetical protein [Colwellia sp. BRX10-4]MBA6397587.1 hypothetical protein [Colwellia sp. BRX10-4]